MIARAAQADALVLVRRGERSKLRRGDPVEFLRLCRPERALALLAGAERRRGQRAAARSHEPAAEPSRGALPAAGYGA